MGFDGFWVGICYGFDFEIDFGMGFFLLDSDFVDFALIFVLGHL